MKAPKKVRLSPKVKKKPKAQETQDSTSEPVTVVISEEFDKLSQLVHDGLKDVRRLVEDLSFKSTKRALSLYSTKK